MESANATSIGLVVPVLNTERHLDSLLPALQRQTVQPDRFLVMDSQSDDAPVFISQFYSEYVEFRRAFNIGAFHSSAPWLHESFGGDGAKGRKFVASELRYLASHAH